MGKRKKKGREKVKKYRILMLSLNREEFSEIDTRIRWGNFSEFKT